MKKADILVALMLVPICLYVFYESGKWPKQALIGAPTLIPWGVAFVLLCGCRGAVCSGPVPEGRSLWRNG